MNEKKCKHIECEELNAPYLGLCAYHVQGGIFASGETYEQYQIIEQDFIDFIKIFREDYGFQCRDGKIVFSYTTW